MSNYDKVREQIARKYWLGLVKLEQLYTQSHKGIDWKEEDFDKQELIDKNPHYAFADAILSIPNIAVLAENQENPYPKDIVLSNGDRLPNAKYGAFQLIISDLRQLGFVKVEDKPEKED